MNELVKRYTRLKQGVRYNTRVSYDFVKNLLKKEDFGQRMIGTIKPSDAQLFVLKLHEDGKGYSTIQSVRGDPTYNKYYDEFVLLSGTGMRVSELWSLTKSDLDFWTRTKSPRSPCTSKTRCAGP